MASLVAPPVDREGRPPFTPLAPPPQGSFAIRPHRRPLFLPIPRWRFPVFPSVEDPVPPSSLDRMISATMDSVFGFDSGPYVSRELLIEQAKLFSQAFDAVHFGRPIEVPSSCGNNITMLKKLLLTTHANGMEKYDMKELWYPHFAVIDPSSYRFLEVKAFGPLLAEEKAVLYDDLDKISLLSMNFNAHKKTMHNCHDHNLRNYSLLELQFVPGLPSIRLCTKALVEPFHGIESLNACFNWCVGEHDGNTWVLPTERPLGPGANSSSGFAVTFLWLDSGCTHHVVCDYRLLVNCRAPPAGKNVRIADGSLMPVRAVGTIEIQGFWIPEVYYVPGAILNLISPGQLAVHHKINSSLDADSCVLWTGQHIDLVGEGIRDERRGLYRLTFLYVP